MTELPRRRTELPFKDLFDINAMRAELAELATSVLNDGKANREIELRSAVARHLKAAYVQGHATAERWLMQDGSGRRCAERLSRLQDEIILLVYELVVAHLYPSDNPSTAERMAVVAVGGYGRGLMAPGSDTDILFLLPYKQTAWGESVAESMLYVLWDMGLKIGHATRSVDECIRQARADMTIRTALLEARLLLGERVLFDELNRRFDAEVVEGTAVEFVDAKLAEREDRLKRSGQSRYLVEPNVKDGKGGLRDLHTLFWIAKYVYRVRETRDLVAKGVFTAEEAKEFRRCEDFLWSVRCHLHFLTGKAEERLSFDHQREMAERLGYTEHPGLKDVERFMKHYFLVAKDVGDLTAIVSAALEERHDKPVPRLNRMINRLRRSPRRALKESADFIIDNDRINVADPAAFTRDPVNLIRLFHLAGKYGVAFHPDAMRLATRSLKLITAAVRENAEANRLFLEILSSRNTPEIVLRRMNETGVLGRFVPEFGRIVAMMQFNMYHSYTVDEHLIRAIGVLTEIERNERHELGIASELMAQIKNRQLIYVAVFLHDIAKGRPEDHSIAGARVARKLCPRFGLNAVDTDTVAWLIEQHLTMSTIAQSRDLSDRKTIENFAAVVQSLERMKLLLILTTADIRAVGPGVWNNWKSQLLRTLYYETEPVVTGGFSESNRNERVAREQAEFRAAASKDRSEEELEAYMARLYPSYWLRVDLDRKLAHAEFILEAESRGQALATSTKTDPERGITELTVFAPDHPKLLAVIAGACAAAGANIVDAQINTTTDGRALDTISLTRAFDQDEDELRRGGRIASSIAKSLSGEIKLPEVVARKITKRPRAFTVEPEVTLNNSWSNRHTVVEVTGLDRPGLLYGLTQTLSRLNLNIASAHVATFGERVVDVFYVTDLMGAKIMGAARHSAIRRALLQVLDADDEPNAG